MLRDPHYAEVKNSIKGVRGVLGGAETGEGDLGGYFRSLETSAKGIG
jgi:hypothetical protein